MNFFFQEVKGQRTLLIINTRLWIQFGCQGDSGGIQEGFWTGDDAGNVQGDLGHLACPKCMPRNTNDSAVGMIFLCFEKQ